MTEPTNREPEPAADKARASQASGRSEVDPAADSGLFAKLPHSRPGRRSPRRAGAGPAADDAPSPPGPARAPRRRAEPASRPRAAAAPPEGRAEPAEGQAAGLEELAWAGIAVTAEAATLGVRLLSRALDAARKATERR